MEFRFDVMLYSNFGNGNSGVGNIKRSRGSQVPQPCFKVTCACA